MPTVKHLLYRPVILGAVVLILALLMVMAGFILLNGRNLERIHRVEVAVTRVNQLQAIDHRLQTMLLDAPDDPGLATIRTDLSRMAHNWPDAIPPILDSLSHPTPHHIETAIRRLQALLEQENARERDLLAQVVTATGLELKASLAGMAVLILLLLLGMVLTWRWLLLPLKRMNVLLLQLAEGCFEPIDVRDSGPPWRTLLDNYNRLVNRLAELERARRERTEMLESQVRQAAGALLAQSRDLAQAERLAAVGEVAAGLAHELRNPLAGIRVALHNLRSECEDPDFSRRFDLIIAELERLSRHLNQLLDQARHQPEPLQEIGLARLVDETVDLLRYQIPAAIHIHCKVPDDLRVHMPETGLRQVLINLVLNATQALGESGTIWVDAEIKNDRLTLAVADDGPGFPEELLAHGIRPFASGRDGGTGLGLLMVKRFASGLDGRLRLDRRQPRGARVVLEIPCASPC